MLRKIFMLLFASAIILLLASSLASADTAKFFVQAPANSAQNSQHNRSTIDVAGHSRNFTALFSKPDGARILEHIKFQRTRTIIFSDELTSNCNFQPLNRQLASAENTTRRTEIHQNIQQRK